jgi:hypothetical protein
MKNLYNSIFVFLLFALPMGMFAQVAVNTSGLLSITDPTGSSNFLRFTQAGQSYDMDMSSGDLFFRPNGSTTDFSLQLSDAAGFPATFKGSVNLNNGVTSGTALRVNGAEALWYNGTYFSWGFGGQDNYFADNIGIGVTNPLARLHVTGGDIQMDDTYPFLTLNSTATGNQGFIFQEGGANAAWIWHDRGNDLMRFDNSSSSTRPDLIIDADGDIGMGTVAPTDQLHINPGTNGGIMVEASNYPYIRLKSNGSSEDMTLNYMEGASHVANVGWEGTTNYLYLNNGNGNGSRPDIAIANGGFVGMGTSTPTARLNLKSAASGEFVMRATSSLNNPLFEVQQGGIGAGNFFVYDAAATRTIQFAGQGKFYISSPGNVGIDQNNPSFDFEIGTAAGGGGVAAKPGGGMWAGVSDRRSKSSMDDYTKGLKELMQVNPVSYVYNGKFGTPAGQTHVGVVAQELQEVVPSMILEAKYNTATLEEEESEGYDASRFEEDFLAVDPSEFLYMLINSVKELSTENDSKDERIESLEAELATMREAINQINAKLGNTPVDGSETKLAQQNVEISGKGDVAELAQNHPNPFNENTVIKYFLPEGTTGAHMNIYTAEGKVLKTVKIQEVGVGQVNLRANSLPAGNYMYQLVTDAGVVGSKTMVLVK